MKDEHKGPCYTTAKCTTFTNLPQVFDLQGQRLIIHDPDERVQGERQCRCIFNANPIDPDYSYDENWSSLA